MRVDMVRGDSVLGVLQEVARQLDATVTITPDGEIKARLVGSDFARGALWAAEIAREEAAAWTEDSLQRIGATGAANRILEQVRELDGKGA